MEVPQRQGARGAQRRARGSGSVRRGYSLTDLFDIPVDADMPRLLSPHSYLRRRTSCCLWGAQVVRIRRPGARNGRPG